MMTARGFRMTVCVVMAVLGLVVGVAPVVSAQPCPIPPLVTGVVVAFFSAGVPLAVGVITETHPQSCWVAVQRERFAQERMMWVNLQSPDLDIEVIAIPPSASTSPQ